VRSGNESWFRDLVGWFSSFVTLELLPKLMYALLYKAENPLGKPKVIR